MPTRSVTAAALALLVGTTGVGAAAAAEPTANNASSNTVSTITRSQSVDDTPFQTSLKVDTSGDKVALSWYPSKLATGGISYTVQLIYSTDRYANDPVKTYNDFFVPHTASSWTGGASPEQWNSWREHPETAPQYLWVRLWANAPNGDWSYTDKYAIPLTTSPTVGLSLTTTRQQPR